MYRVLIAATGNPGLVPHPGLGSGALRAWAHGASSLLFVIVFVDVPGVLVLQARVHGCFVLAIEADYAT